MKVAIMQPYLFPYLGYYQLVNHCDVFVLYDDVTYIKQGYINRNNILQGGQPLRITLPVPGASSNKIINTLEFSRDTRKIQKTITQAYSKAPFYHDVFPLIKRVLDNEDRSIPAVCKKGINEVFSYLNMPKEIILSSNIEYDREATAENKILQICQALGSRDYVNSIGGKKMYTKEAFSSKGYDLSFIEMKDVVYDQRGADFVPNLSIIDVLMWCGRDETKQLLSEYRIS